jgi:hypothetical protein
VLILRNVNVLGEDRGIWFRYKEPCLVTNMQDNILISTYLISILQYFNYEAKIKYLEIVVENIN